MTNYLTKQEMKTINNAIKILEKVKYYNNYIKAYELFMEYFDQIDEENQAYLDKELNKLGL